MGYDTILGDYGV